MTTTQGIAHRVAAMLTSAAAEPDWRRTWARVNRAAGMVARWSSHFVDQVGEEHDLDPDNAGRNAEHLVSEITLLVTGDPRRVKMVIEGLTKRVGRALCEWYVGTSPEDGKARVSDEGPEVDNG